MLRPSTLFVFFFQYIFVTKKEQEVWLLVFLLMCFHMVCVCF